MDSACEEITLDFFDIEATDTEFVPVPFLPVKTKLNVTSSDKRTVAWIGRIGGEKVHSLIFFLESLNISKQKWTVIIIGDGNCIDQVKEKKFENLSLKYKGYVQNEQLEQELRNERIGLVAGMRTTVLETSYMKISSILLDLSYNKFTSSYMPRWVSQIEKYTLGHYDYKKYNNQGESIQTMLSDYLNDTQDKLAEECFEYTINNHSLSKTCDLLEEHI